VKIVRPILKEMEDFHASLYVLYHYQNEPVPAGEGRRNRSRRCG